MCVDLNASLDEPLRGGWGPSRAELRSWYLISGGTDRSPFVRFKVK